MDNIKLLTHNFFESEDRNFLNLNKLLSWPPALVQRLLVCDSKFNLKSISTPNNSTFSFDYMVLSPIWIDLIIGIFDLDITFAWNLDGFAIISFSFNHFNAILLSELRVVIRSSNMFDALDKELSSAKPYCVIQSFRKRVKKHIKIHTLFSFFVDSQNW